MQLFAGRVRATVALVFVVAVLAGCASAPAAEAPNSPPSSPPADPTPRPAEAAFGGDCAAALSDAEISEGFGVSMTLRRNVPEAATAGGLACWWNSADWTTAGLTVFPVEVVPQSLLDARSVPACEESIDAVLCREARTVGDVWVELTFGGAETTPPPAFDVLFPRVLDRLAASPVPTAAEPADAWWDTDCAVVEGAAPIAAHLGDGYLPGYPGDGVRGDEHTVLVESGHKVYCDWYAPEAHGFVSITLYPGAAPLWEKIVAEHEGVAPTTISGATEAVSWTPVDVNLTGTIATDGVNVILVSGSGVDSAVMAANILAAV